MTVAPFNTARIAVACCADGAVTGDPSGICTTRPGSPPALAGTAAAGADCWAGGDVPGVDGSGFLSPVSSLPVLPSLVFPPSPSDLPCESSTKSAGLP